MYVSVHMDIEAFTVINTYHHVRVIHAYAVTVLNWHQLEALVMCAHAQLALLDVTVVWRCVLVVVRRA